MRILIAAILALSTSANAAPPTLLMSQQFTLQQPHTYLWRAESPAITQGTIVVVGVTQEDARPRQAGGAVLYVGDTPAERTNNGDSDGAIIAFVPGHVDLNTQPIFWGPDTLPERVDAKAGRAALAQTQTSPTDASIVTATRKPSVHLTDTAALYRRIADLIDVHAPSESERARGYRGERP